MATNYNNEKATMPVVDSKDGPIDGAAAAEETEIEQFEGVDKDDAQHTLLIDEALQQAHEESQLGLRKMIKLYYPGLTYGMLLSLALVMEVSL